ncbi:MAG: peptidoglycan bridge formation glycyltransferase FemA/FemB family protein [Candidatus Moraniibacteriota bacterium]|nr:MAG: peptidoglycan bridge formation glycyltransferase FemA/FemB family protein [Candidatus Moranbacteria bacterium]
MNQEESRIFLNSACPDGGLLQSEPWRFFQEKEGLRTYHFESEALWANVLEHSLPLVGRYWYIPRGPVLKSVLSPHAQSYWQEVVSEARTLGVPWIRVEPRDEEVLQALKKWSAPYSLLPARHDMQPREIAVLDITPPETELLSAMKPKTRYHIGLAEKRGVLVTCERSEEVFEDFVRLTEETARRNNITPHTREHYRNFRKFFPSETLECFVARHNGAVIAAILVSFFGKTATYLHGASSTQERNTMASFLLQWEAIREAKRRGCADYDFGGIDTKGIRPSLSGVTRFKRGFGKNVKIISFPGSFDIPLSQSRYMLYNWISMSRNSVKNATMFLTK